jgi:hypothetical protein
VFHSCKIADTSIDYEVRTTTGEPSFAVVLPTHVAVALLEQPGA